MARAAIAVGGIGLHVAQNIARLRQVRNLTTRSLSGLTAEVGRTIPASGITRIESGERRVDVDDLAVLAQVLGVKPEDLLTPPDRLAISVSVARIGGDR